MEKEQDEEFINYKLSVIEDKIADVKSDVGNLKDDVLEIKQNQTRPDWKIIILLVLLAGLAGERVLTLADHLLPSKAHAAEEIEPAI